MVKRSNLAFIAGLIASVAILYGLGKPATHEPLSARMIGNVSDSSPVIDIQKDGPLLGGQRAASLAEAQLRIPYQLPVPPTNQSTGEQTGIWTDDMDQVAFVWSTNLRLYVAKMGDVIEPEFFDFWINIVANDSS